MTMFNKIVKEFQWGQHTVRMETGEIARQASGAVIVDVEDTVVLATVVAAKSPKAGQDFFGQPSQPLEDGLADGGAHLGRGLLEVLPGIASDHLEAAKG